MAKTLASLFASLAFLLIGGKVFVKLMSTSISDVIYVLKMASIGAFAFGMVGYWMGTIMQTGREFFVENREKFEERDKELLIDDLLAYDIGVRNSKKKGMVKKTENE